MGLQADGYAGNCISFTFAIKCYCCWILFFYKVLFSFCCLLMPFCLSAAFFFHAIFTVDGVLFLVFASCVNTAEVNFDYFTCSYNYISSFFPTGVSIEISCF
ncbi:hypothetical protein D3C73_1169820 [compost metagenome]